MGDALENDVDQLDVEAGRQERWKNFSLNALLRLVKDEAKSFPKLLTDQEEVVRFETTNYGHYKPWDEDGAERNGLNSHLSGVVLIVDAGILV